MANPPKRAPKPLVADNQSILLVYLDKIANMGKKYWNNNYNNFLRADLNKPSDNNFFVNLLFNQKKINQLSEATSLLISALIPKIRIAKVIQTPYTTDPSKGNFTKEEFAKKNLYFSGELAPEDQRQSYSFLLPFEDYLQIDSISTTTSEEENFISFSEKYGKSFGSGIEGLTIDDKSNVAAGIADIFANIRFRFSSFDLLFKEYVVVSQESPKVFAKVKFKDLFAYPLKENQNAGTAQQQIDPEAFRLLLTIGWAYDEKMLKRISYGSETLTSKDIEDIKSSLEKSSYTFDLIYQEFSTTITENGAVKVEGKYRSSIQTTLGSRDIDVLYYLNDKGFAENSNTLRQDLERLYSLKSYLDRLDKTKTKAAKDSKGRITAADKKKIAEFAAIKAKALQLIEQQESYDTYFMHKQILQTLLDNQRIYTLDIPLDDIGKIQTGMYGKTVQTKKGPKKVFDLSDTTSVFVETKSTRAIILPAKSDVFDSEKKSVESLAITSKDKATVEAKKKTLSDQLYKSATNIKNKVIHFIYLGDVLEYIFGCLRREGKEQYQSILPVIGNFCIAEPKELATSQEDSKTIKKIVMGDPSIYNLCDFPISLEKFKRFLFETITKENLQNIRLETFLEALFKELMPSATTGNLFNTEYRKTMGSLTKGYSFMRTITKAGENIPREVLTGHTYEEIKLRKKEIKKITVDENISIPNYDVEKVSKNRGITYFYIFYKQVGEGYGISLNSDERDSYGIVNIQLGVDKGLVKKVNFEKSNIKYMAEGVYVENKSNNPRTNPFLLQGLMNIDVEMIGNTFFKPGSSLYLDPSFMLTSPNISAREIKEFGLGGYYNVVNVNYSLESGKFTTKVKAVFQHSNSNSNLGDPYVSKRVDAELTPQEKIEQATAALGQTADQTRNVTDDNAKKLADEKAQREKEKAATAKPAQRSRRK